MKTATDNNRKKNRIYLGITIGTILILLIAFTLNKNKRTNASKMATVSEVNSAVMVRTDTVSMEILDDVFSANGNFAAHRQVDFSSEVSGRVLEVLVDEGEFVKQGQVLATIKADAIGVDLENAEAVYKSALKDKERFENSFNSGGVTQQQLDQIRLALKNAESRLEQMKLRFGDTRIKSTINGFVNKRYIEQGAFVGMGAPLFEIVDISRLNLKVNVNENQVTSLSRGDSVEIRASALPEKKFMGKVNFVAVKADQTLNFPVEIELANNPDNSLKAGMYGTAIFKPTANTQKQKVLTVPRTAFVGSVNEGELFVIKDNKAILRKVVPGRIYGNKVEILKGLSQGETVVTSGQINLQDGSTVTVAK